MTQTSLRDRLKNIIQYEGINQKHIAKQTSINEGVLSRFKNDKSDLGMLDREALDKYLVSKGY